MFSAADVQLLQQFGLQWAAGLNPTDPLVSPLYGSLAGLPPTTVYSGSLERLAPDTLRLRQQAIAQGDSAQFTFVLRQGQIHTWPLDIPLPDALTALHSIELHLGITKPQPGLAASTVRLSGSQMPVALNMAPAA